MISPHIQAQTLEYYLPFDDGSSASLANDGSLGGTATAVSIGGGTPTASSFVDSVLGGSYSEYFDGDGGIQLPDSTGQFTLDSSSADSMTISTWVYLNSYTGGIANKSTDSATPGWTAYFGSDGTIHYQFTNPSGEAQNGTTTSIGTGQWVNLVLVSGPGVGDIKFYFNGVNQATQNMYAGTGGPLDSSDSTLPIIAGAYATTYGSLNGYEDDYAMWNGILIPGEISSIYTAPELLTGYNAGVMDTLFQAYSAQGSTAVGTLTWNYATGFDTTGHSLGDTWTAGGNDYIWLDGTAVDAEGLTAVAPEPTSLALLAIGLTGLFARQRWIKSRLSI